MSLSIYITLLYSMPLIICSFNARQWIGAATGYSLEPVPLSETVTSTIAARGANYTLTIKKFNPIKHGGDYKCIGKVKRYKESLSSNRFTIKSMYAVVYINK